jgi:Protein of unknown function (DUF5672)
MLRLDDISLTMVETMEHALGRLAINDCVTKAHFASVLIFTDQPELFQPLECDAQFITVPNWPTKQQWSKFSWHGMVPHVRTSMICHVQWDSAVWEPNCWTDEFLKYDIVGAPWPWHATKRVGNLGFSLRSTRIVRYLYNHRDKFPIINAVDDDLICRVYRVALEDAGFVWAPEHVARRFAFECEAPNLETRHFGFHACYNFRHVLDHDALLQRARLMRDSEYIGRKNSYMWKNFCEACPEIIAELERETSCQESSVASSSTPSSIEQRQTIRPSAA